MLALGSAWEIIKCNLRLVQYWSRLASRNENLHRSIIYIVKLHLKCRISSYRIALLVNIFHEKFAGLQKRESVAMSRRTSSAWFEDKKRKSKLFPSGEENQVTLKCASISQSKCVRWCSFAVLILNHPKYLYESFASKKIYIHKLSFIVIFNII